MSQLNGQTTVLLNRHRNGDPFARSELIVHAQERFLRLSRQMLRTFPNVKRWEGTDDVSQNALIRLLRALARVTPQSSLHFWNLAALEIRRELLDMADHHLGPQGEGAKHHTDPKGRAADDQGGLLHASQDNTSEPCSLADWTRFHEQVQALPDEEREVFNLIWYAELTQQQAAEQLHISLRTLKRRWLKARILLSKCLASWSTPGKRGGSDERQ